MIKKNINKIIKPSTFKELLAVKTNINLLFSRDDWTIEEAFKLIPKTLWSQRSIDLVMIELCGEVGELANVYKKYCTKISFNTLQSDDEQRIDAIKDEAGDVIFTLIMLLSCLKLDHREIIKKVMLKISNRINLRLQVK